MNWSCVPEKPVTAAKCLKNSSVEDQGVGRGELREVLEEFLGRDGAAFVLAKHRIAFLECEEPAERVALGRVAKPVRQGEGGFVVDVQKNRSDIEEDVPDHGGNLPQIRHGGESPHSGNLTLETW